MDRPMGSPRPTSHQRGYTTTWRKARRGYLQSHPLCVMCEREGRITPATVVDHIIPHRVHEATASGDPERVARARALFWDSDNWQALCKRHHDRDKQISDRSTAVGCDAQGWPIGDRPGERASG